MGDGLISKKDLQLVTCTYISFISFLKSWNLTPRNKLYCSILVKLDLMLVPDHQSCLFTVLPKWTCFDFINHIDWKCEKFCWKVRNYNGKFMISFNVGFFLSLHWGNSSVKLYGRKYSHSKYKPLTKESSKTISIWYCH